ncbi:hypothetical protein KCU65_g1130, partial [Aureobasidium melanogenum]
MNLKMGALQLDSDDDSPQVSESDFLDIHRNYFQENHDMPATFDKFDCMSMHPQFEAPSQVEQHKMGMTERKVQIARLKDWVTELEKMSQPSSHSSEKEEKAQQKVTEPTQSVKQLVCSHILVMHIDVWVGGEDGTDVELALVKMNTDTPFKIVLEILRDQHPLKALKQKSTGWYIFDSDTPACLGFKDGEELVFIQQNDELMFMLDATMDEVTVWRGKDSRISWMEPGNQQPSSEGQWPPGGSWPSSGGQSPSSGGEWPY